MDSASPRACTKTDAAFETTGEVLKLYRREFGSTPVEVSGTPEPLDVVAAWTEDRGALTIGVVNPTSEPVSLPLTLKDVRLSGRGRIWRITGPNAEAYNEPGKLPAVTVTEEGIESMGTTLRVAPLSATIFKLKTA